MRIAGYIDHPIFKITIFQYQGRFSLKLENSQFEETFKLSEELFPTVDDVKKMVTPEFLQGVQDRFSEMAIQMKDYISSKQNTTSNDEIWPEIF